MSCVQERLPGGGHVGFATWLAPVVLEAEHLGPDLTEHHRYRAMRRTARMTLTIDRM
jgi:hypothetical protein